MSDDLMGDIMLLIVWFWLSFGVLYCAGRLIGVIR